jgi:murein DD-endopeptidase MepM/ murein hydrolase activator NlpD
MTGPDTTPADRVPLRRRIRVLPVVTALTAVTALLCCVGGAGAFMLTSLGGDQEQGRPAGLGAGCGEGGLVKLTDRMPRIDPYGPAQLQNAAAIISVGMQLKVPPRGWVIAVATAMQESALTNLGDLGDRNDHDSVGLFQQRPSQGWGTVAQLRDPAYTARRFYQKLLTVPQWQTRPLTDVAQRVQVSAFPDAYAKHEPLATEIVNALANGAARAAGAARSLRCAAVGEIAASGWTVPVSSGRISSNFEAPDRPGHHGIDIAAPKGTEIRVAATGRVLVVRCQPDNSGRQDCDVDGYQGKGGCGWYVDVLHAGDIITRYCHMLQHPRVSTGQLVRAGTVIGLVGTSGDSSGPHLHFEVHEHGDRGPAGAINPMGFMARRGAALDGRS